MRWQEVALVGLIVSLWCAERARCQVSTLDPAKVENRIRELEHQLETGARLDDSDADRVIVRALITIINRQSGPTGDKIVRGRALTALGEYPDISEGISALIDNIDRETGRLRTDLSPIAPYRAAQALVKIGVPARRLILKVLVEPIPDHRLHLMAHVLAELDQDDELALDVTTTVFRLRREIEQTKEYPFGNEELRTTKVRNLEKLIAILSEPTFPAKQIPASAKDIQRQPPSSDSLIERFLKEESKNRP